MILSGDTTVADLATTMKELSDNTAVALTNLAKFGKGVQDTVGPIATIFEKFITYTQPFFNSIVFGDALTFAKKQADPMRMGGYPSSALGPGYIDPNAAARKKAEADAAKRAKELAALQKKTLDTQKKQNALTKASKTLDLDRIGATAALKGKISESDRLSLELQLALLDKNDALATKLSADLEAAVKRNNELRAALLATPLAPNPYANWYPPILAPLSPAAMDLGGASVGLGGVMPDFNVPANAYSQVGPMGGLGAGVIAGVNTNINVTVELNGQEIAGAIRENQINDSLSGSFAQTNRFAAKGATAI
jgi:hypothetical protein